MARRPGRPPPPRDPFDPLDGRVADTFDLHGATGVQARAQVGAYLQRARQRHPGELVHIITGRGRNSPGRPVLRPTVQAVLRAAPAALVARWGPDYDGGGFLVRLGGGLF
ncbi:MAG TPA: Smr/MutS family protein [Gemmatimonadales bacterium]|nr:Smr/MutS family protein [Gemmatimonadales bacterium]